MPETYLYRKLTERVLGFSQREDGGTFAMEQGTILESEARPWFEFTHEVQVQQVGFVTTDDGRVGCSPDGLIGEDGGIEIKCPQPGRHLRYLLGGECPREYMPQVQGCMFVTGRKWWNFLSYSRQFPPLLVRVESDEHWQDAIACALDSWIGKFDKQLARITAIRDADNSEKLAAYEAKGSQ